MHNGIILYYNHKYTRQNMFDTIIYKFGLLLEVYIINALYFYHNPHPPLSYDYTHSIYMGCI